MQRQSVFIVDDHTRVQVQLANWLNREEGLVVVGMSANAPETLKQILESRPDIVVIDVAAHGRGDLRLLHSLRDKLPHANVVVLTAFADTALEKELRDLGVHRTLPKELPSADLVKTLTAL
ncbi:MAG: DNA-binding response regulator [Chloroflexi bacterium]|nr:MAG: DNA-binding response regulator [Chloroflexota bacterium]MBL1194420.1 DNA-binding response regulator [Chloroflexota bacterium]NOH11708.1 response regulator transcription factor [Chloroflexota bacterium]